MYNSVSTNSYNWNSKEKPSIAINCRRGTLFFICSEIRVCRTGFDLPMNYTKIYFQLIGFVCFFLRVFHRIPIEVKYISCLRNWFFQEIMQLHKSWCRITFWMLHELSLKYHGIAAVTIRHNRSSEINLEY